MEEECEDIKIEMEGFENTVCLDPRDILLPRMKDEHGWTELKNGKFFLKSQTNLSKYFSVARVRPRTSKGITDLLLLVFEFKLK